MSTKFKIITPAYNCAESIRTTLFSVIGQDYADWEMIICDDMSTDNTVSVINEIAENNNLSNRITVNTRQEKHGEVRNTIVEAAQCNDDDVIIRLDAGDFITDLGCFSILNYFYSEHDPAVLWTGHRWRYSNFNISGPIDPNISVYKQPWRSSHLKTFRVRDFRGLNELNFKDDNGDWIMIGCDQAIFLPMLERARINKRPLIYLPACMYHYDTPAADDPSVFREERSKKQKASAEWIRERGYIE